MKKIVFPFLAVTLLSSNVTGQIEVKESVAKRPDTSSTQGFFMNKGATKIASLECYDFSDMIVAFDIDESFLDYDYIQVDVSLGGYRVYQNSGRRYTQEEFRKSAYGKKYLYVNVFSKEDLKEQSQFGFNRADLEYHYHGIIPRKEDKTLNVSISGWKITSTKTVYSQRSDGSVEAVNVDKEEGTTLTRFQIDLLNRKKKFVVPLIGGLLLKEMPSTTGNCYK